MDKPTFECEMKKIECEVLGMIADNSIASFNQRELSHGSGSFQMKANQLRNLSEEFQKSKKQKNRNDISIECSHCPEWVKPRWKFCPNCGGINEGYENKN